MKELIPMDEYGVFADMKDTIRIDSRYVAQIFGKQHKNVIRDIENLECSEEFSRLNFEPAKYKDEQGKPRPCYQMTRDGFTLLVMGFTGKKAMKFKEAYILRFNEMESRLSQLKADRMEFPMLTEVIKQIHEEPKPYHYSNEVDMINRIVLGMSAKQFREANGIPKGESIRPYLTEEQLEQIDKLQRMDIGLMIAVPEFAKRKELLAAQLKV